MNFLPDTLRTNCRRGLRMAMQAAASEKPPPLAIEFAEMMSDGFVPDMVMAQSCVDAHAEIDKRALSMGTVDGYGSMTALLWGGEEGRDHCAQVLRDAPVIQPKSETKVPVGPDNETTVPVESEPDLVAADLENEDSPLHDLCVKLDRIDTRALDQLEAATTLAYLGALRALTREVSSVLAERMKPDYREEVGQEIVDQRGAARSLYRHAARSPYVAAGLVPDAVLATLTIDQEDAIRRALADLEVTADQILKEGQDATVAALAEELDTTQDEVRAQLAELMDEQRDSAVALLVGSLTAFTLSRADRTDGQVTEGLENAVIPAQMISDATSVAGGAVVSGNTLARTGDGLIELVGGGTTEAVGVTSGWLDRTARRVFGRSLTTVYEWDYGSPAERERPRVDHQRLDGQQWSTAGGRQRFMEQVGDVLVEGDIGPDVFPGSLPGCKCRARRISLDPLIKTDAANFNDA